MQKFFSFLLILLPVFSFSQIGMIELDSRKVPEPVIRDPGVESWNRSQPGYSNLPEEAKQMLYWTNYCRTNPQKFWDSVMMPVLNTFPDLNKADAKNLRTDLIKTGPLPMFSLNSLLIGTAQSHASDIGNKKAPLGHNSTDGTDFGTRIKRAGIRFCANENISLSSQGVLLAVILLYLDIGLPEKGHRKTLLDRNLTEIGIGSALYSADQYFLVEDLACKQ